MLASEERKRTRLGFNVNPDDREFYQLLNTMRKYPRNGDGKVIIPEMGVQDDDEHGDDADEIAETIYDVLQEACRRTDAPPRYSPGYCLALELTRWLRNTPQVELARFLPEWARLCELTKLVAAAKMLDFENQASSVCRYIVTGQEAEFDEWPEQRAKFEKLRLKMRQEAESKMDKMLNAIQDQYRKIPDGVFKGEFCLK